jgi:redox-sensitive bicupin YhaK (pirin superfamily)
MKQEHWIRKANETSEGDGVDVKRLFPVSSYMNFDPFVLWDHFNVRPGSGFPDHPHRGFEGITFMFSGSMEHKDNLGNQSRVGAGGAQRFTAGSGIVHAEMPGSEGDNEGIQLWVNLARADKTVDPEYQQVEADEFPRQAFDQGSVITIVGEGSPLKIKTPFIYKQLILQAGAKYSEIIPKDFHGFVYVAKGAITVSQQAVQSGEAFFTESVSELDVHADQDSVAMLCFGMAHHEPIYQHGPYVD